jgi:hypothetical protein
MDPHRRRLLQRAGLWAAAWPLTRLREARAQADLAPKRVVIVFSPNGPIMERGPAVGAGERDFRLHEWWQPLERHKQDGLFFAGLFQAGVPYGKHNEFGHQSAGTGALTARTTEGTNHATGPSIDQFIGQELERAGVVTPRRTLLWGTHRDVGSWGPWYEAAGKAARVQNDPYQALEALRPARGSGSGSSAAPAAVELARKRLMLDHAYGDCRALAGRLGATGKALLDFHCNNIESLEKSLAASLAAPAPSACTPPASPGIALGPGTSFDLPDTHDQSMKAFTDLVALAFACDVTRVVGISFGATAARNALPASYGVPSAPVVDSQDSGAQHHAWTHVYDAGRFDQKRAALRAFTRFYAEKVAAIADKLKATPDAGGKSLFDSTLILWTSELGTAGPTDAHPNQNIPVVLLGNGGGKIATGRFHDGDGRHESGQSLVLHSLFVSLARHAGLAHVDRFGNQGQGPLEWLEG